MGGALNTREQLEAAARAARQEYEGLWWAARDVLADECRERGWYVESYEELAERLTDVNAHSLAMLAEQLNAVEVAPDPSRRP